MNKRFQIVKSIIQRKIQAISGWLLVKLYFKTWQSKSKQMLKKKSNYLRNLYKISALTEITFIAANPKRMRHLFTEQGGWTRFRFT